MAAAAEVAPRTVPLYFCSRQDIALSRFTESMDQLTARLCDREPHDTAMEILGRWLGRWLGPVVKFPPGPPSGRTTGI
ncbi:hypothetical protein ACFVYV_40545 [Streptomyces mirabilis]|uniref:hypothetical protein n=1 Tax=Streptomyces mirabilis TaxID=68239 RepID=UPI0036D7EBB4